MPALPPAWYSQVRTEGASHILSDILFEGCQDTGTAIVVGKKGEKVWTNCESDEEELRYISHDKV